MSNSYDAAMELMDGLDKEYIAAEPGLALKAAHVYAMLGVSEQLRALRLELEDRPLVASSVHGDVNINRPPRGVETWRPLTDEEKAAKHE